MRHRAHWIRLLCFAAALCSREAAHADSGPQTPCESEPVPPYPELDHSPVVKVWGRSDLGRELDPSGLHRLVGPRFFDAGRHGGAVP